MLSKNHDRRGKPEINHCQYRNGSECKNVNGEHQHSFIRCLINKAEWWWDYFSECIRKSFKHTFYNAKDYNITYLKIPKLPQNFFYIYIFLFLVVSIKFPKHVLFPSSFSSSPFPKNIKEKKKQT